MIINGQQPFELSEQIDEFPVGVVGFDTDIHSELRQLDRRVINVWRFEALSEGAIVLVLSAGATIALRAFDVPLLIALIPLAGAMLFEVGNLLIMPPRRWQSWQYAVGPAEIELRHGIWWQTRTRIPMARIQHVDTRRGPIDRRYGLATVVLYTAAGARQIPGLSIAVAEDLRDQITELANVRGDV